MGARTKRETLISAQTSATTGTNARKTTGLLAGRDLDLFEELLLHLRVTTALAGTAPTMDIVVQRAVKPNPSATVDDDWERLAGFTQVGVGTNGDQVLHLPALDVMTGAAGAKANARDAVTAGQAKPGHWGDQIRILEVMGGTVTTAAVYSLHATGITRSSE